MQVHESQQSAAVVATIAVLVGNKLSEKIDKEIREAIGDVITWDVPLVNSDNDWPKRKKYTPRSMFSSSEDFSQMKMVVHGYLGLKASKEIEQFLTTGELRRIAHYVDGVWIAPTRSTFKSYLPDVFPEKPYVIHQNSPLAWSILSYIHQEQDETPLKRASTNLHKQKNTLYLESLKYGMILHAKRILRTIEDGCMKCLRRKKKFLKQRIGQPLEASFKSDIPPFSMYKWI